MRKKRICYNLCFQFNKNVREIKENITIFSKEGGKRDKNESVINWELTVLFFSQKTNEIIIYNNINNDKKIKLVYNEAYFCGRGEIKKII